MILELVLAAAINVQPFVEKNTTALAVEQGDLNGDGREDAVIVLEPQDEEAPRPLLILVSDANGKLKLAKRSANAAFCRTCGGMMGDPFAGVRVEKNRFTIQHYGGSSWRWSAEFTFGWSKRDQSWQLVRVEKHSFHASDPENVEKTIQKPPKDFGLIDITEFDPENYEGRGKK